MSEAPDARAALIDLLKEQGVEPGQSISLYKIGPPLIDQGISQDRIVFALYELKEEGIIDLLNDNRLLLIKSIAD